MEKRGRVALLWICCWRGRFDRQRKQSRRNEYIGFQITISTTEGEEVEERNKKKKHQETKQQMGRREESCFIVGVGALLLQVTKGCLQCKTWGLRTLVPSLLSTIAHFSPRTITAIDQTSEIQACKFWWRILEGCKLAWDGGGSSRD